MGIIGLSRTNVKCMQHNETEGVSSVCTTCGATAKTFLLGCWV